MDYYKAFYSPENVTTIIVGDFDNEVVLKKVVDEFNGKWGERGADRRVNKIDSPVTETKYFEQTSQIESAFLMFGYLGPLASDLKKSISLEIISLILGDGASSRLYQNLIEKQKVSIFNMVNSEHYQFKEGDNFFIQANFKPEKKDLAISLIKHELEVIQKSPVSKDEFLKAKKKIKSKFASGAETVSDIGDEIGYYMTVCNDLKLIEDYLTVLEEITIEDLQKTAQEYLNIDRAVISVLLPE